MLMEAKDYQPPYQMEHNISSLPTFEFLLKLKQFLPKRLQK